MGLFWDIYLKKLVSAIQHVTELEQSTHCQGTSTFWNTIQHEIHTWPRPSLMSFDDWLVRSKEIIGEKRISGTLAGGLVKPNDSLWSATVVLLQRLMIWGGRLHSLHIWHSGLLQCTCMLFALWTLVTFSQLLDCVFHGFCWSIKYRSTLI